MRIKKLHLVGAAVSLAIGGCGTDSTSGAPGRADGGDASAASGSTGGRRATSTPDASIKTGAGGGGSGTAGASGTLDASGAGTSLDAGAVMNEGGRSTGAHTDGGGSLCPSLGWCELKDTKLMSVCPDADRYAAIQGYEGCGGVINDWNGGIGDTGRNRLLVWGGGHHGYFGNELYALDLNDVVMRRLNDPSDVSGIDLTDCTPPESYSDGRPSARHTYDGLTYLPKADQMYAFAGAGIPCGYGVHSTWTLDLSTIETAPAGKAAPWRDMAPAAYPTKAGYGLVSDYDPGTSKVILNDGYNLWSYDASANQYALLNDSNATNAHIDYHMTGRVDPKRKRFVVVGGGTNGGGGMQVFDIAAGSPHAQEDWTGQVTGCSGLLNASSPGWAYDSVQDRLIGWAGGDTVYVFDADTKTCTTVQYGGGPGAANENGTFGRFRYFPALNVFAIVNDAHANAYTLRLKL